MFISTITYANHLPNGGVELLPYHVVSDVQPYASGGVTFSYPTGTFTVPPYINLTVQTDTTTYTTAMVITPIITVNIASQTVVMLNIVTGTISEAGSGSFYLHLTATGPADTTVL